MKPYQNTLLTFMSSWLLSLCLLLGLSSSGFSQYFGRNKVQYDDFEFKVLHTEHFEVYYYPSETRAVTDAARMIERWYTRLSKTFNHRFINEQPLILYANHADFQQTNVIGGLINQGTGGVTEGLQNRIVIPLTGVYRQNDHVLGHELVHGFQYDIAKSGKGGLRGLSQSPLWLIEGLAEYLSSGRKDSHTAMWMRDAVLNEDVPTIHQMSTDPRYFPYRYGQAMWAYIAGRWGDGIIDTLFIETLLSPLDSAFIKVLGRNSDSLSAEWQREIRRTYQAQVKDRSRPEDVGQAVLSPQIDAGEMNLAPAISPDGNYVAFLSEKDLFTIDLYLADARSGKVLKKLSSSNSDAHFDALRFMNSSGAWSPDGGQFAFVVFAEGDNAIVIIDRESRDVKRKIKLPQVGAIYHISWSPDGNSLVFSGSKGGISDLYRYDLKSKAVDQLTDDRYADLQPAWSPDGKTIAVVTDRGPETDLKQMRFGDMQIALYDLNNHQIEVLNLFQYGKHINPQFSPDGKGLFFVADPDGFSNIYYLSFGDQRIHQVTNVASGISGITALSSCLSVATRTGRLMFSVFQQNNYYVHALDMAEALNGASVVRRQPVIARKFLPPQEALVTSKVYDYLNDYESGFPSDSNFSVSDYSASLSLKTVGQTSLGVGGSQFGTYIGGAVAFLFGDMLNNHTLAVAAQINGTFKDLGGQVGYLNRDKRFNWGATASHIPYRVERAFTRLDTVTINDQGFLGQTIAIQRQRVFDDRLSLLGEYPLTTNRRLEFSAGYNRISYSLEEERITTTLAGQVINREERDLDAPPALNLVNAGLAYVGDYSFFGFTSPVKGKRYRIEVQPTFGSLQYVSLLADYRHYFFRAPLTFALRGLHFGRYGGDAESDRLTPLFLGYETFVRGYTSLDASECSNPEDPNKCPEFDRLLGSRIAVFNAEVRLPLFGTERFGLLNFPFLPTELLAFFDGGLAWTSGEPPVFKFKEESDQRTPVFSSGLAARFNIFRAFIAQVYYAIPFQRPQKDGKLGFFFAVGW